MSMCTDVLSGKKKKERNDLQDRRTNGNQGHPEEYLCWVELRHFGGGGELVHFNFNVKNIV